MKKLLGFAKKAFVLLAVLVVVALVFGRGGDEQKDGGSGQQTEISRNDDSKEVEKEKEASTSGDGEQKAESVEYEKEPEPEESSNLGDSSIRPEFQEAMDSYEAFYDEYVEYMKLYNADPTNAELLAGYSDLVLREAEMSEKFDAWENEDMTSAESAYYIKVQARVLDKLSEIA